MRKLTASLSIRNLSHAAIQHRLKNGSLILNGRALEYVITRISGGLLGRFLGLLLMMLLNPLSRLYNNVIGLVSELRS